MTSKNSTLQHHGEMEMRFIKHYHALLEQAIQDNVCVYCMLAAHFQFVEGAMKFSQFDMAQMNVHLAKFNLGLLMVGENLADRCVTH